MYSVTKKCSQCGSQRVEKRSMPDNVIPVNQGVQEMAGASVHEGCGGQWEEVSRVNLNEVKENLTRLRDEGVDLTDAMNKVRQGSMDNEE